MQLHTILDEMILGGQVIETSSEQIMRSVEEIARFLLPAAFPLHMLRACLHVILTVFVSWRRLEKQSNTTSLIPKSISERFSRWAVRASLMLWTETLNAWAEEIRLHFSPVALRFSQVASIYHLTWTWELVAIVNISVYPAWNWICDLKREFFSTIWFACRLPVEASCLLDKKNHTSLFLLRLMISVLFLIECCSWKIAKALCFLLNSMSDAFIISPTSVGWGWRWRFWWHAFQTAKRCTKWSVSCKNFIYEIDSKILD